MDEQKPDNDQKPWFGLKQSGFGRRPTSWQGRLVVFPLLIVEVIVVSIAPHLHTYWFKAKTSGSGFVPATWQGWLVTVGPGLLVIIVVGLIYYKQRPK